MARWGTAFLGVACLIMVGCTRYGFNAAGDGPAAGGDSQTVADGPRDGPGGVAPDGPVDMAVRPESGPSDVAVLGENTVVPKPDIPITPALDLAPKKDMAPWPLDAVLAPDAPPPVLSAVFSKQPANLVPSPRRSTGAALQQLATHDRIWIFGGFAGLLPALFNQLYFYDTAKKDWAEQTVSKPPTARERHVLGWDAANDLLVMFGGQTLLQHLDELHLFDPANSSWKQISNKLPWPAARKDVAMVWVPHLSAFILYGGNNGTAAKHRFTDLWQLTISKPSTATWKALTPGPTANVPAQSGGCVAYDPKDRRLILFGGETQDGMGTNATWQYLVDKNVWQKDNPTGVVPSARAFCQCGWNPQAKRVVLHGGQSNQGSPMGGTFTYDPTTKVWTSHKTAGTGGNPGARADGGAVYSPALGGLFWFGGRTGTVTYTNESWLLVLK